MTKKAARHPALELVEEYKLYRLLGEPEDARLEASGVCTAGECLYIIFDNMPDVACIGGLPPLDHPGNRWFREPSRGYGFEDVAYDPHERHFYMLVEAAAVKGGRFRPLIEEYDADLTFLEQRWVDFEFDNENKGFESVGFSRRGDLGLLYMLCEGNKCKSGKAGRAPGGGRIHIFRKVKKHWGHIAEIKLPESVLFEDYSGIEIIGDGLGVVSQASAAIWLGRLTPDGLGISGDGAVYELPRDEADEVVYCNAEGIAWLDHGRIVIVSDRMKQSSQPGRCAVKDQSLHVFRIPDDHRFE